MNSVRFAVVIVLALLKLAPLTRGVEPAVADVSFNAAWSSANATNMSTFVSNAPPWFVTVEQSGGRFTDNPACWQPDAAAAAGTGRLAIVLDRAILREDVAVAILYDGKPGADLIVQLFDEQDRAVALDLFGNLVTVGQEAQTDTFIVPLRKFPGATKVVIRRVNGDLRVYGVALYPVVTEAEADTETLAQLATLLGDPISPHNPLAKALRRIAKQNGLKVNPKDISPAPVKGANLDKHADRPSQRSDADGNVLVDASTPGFYNEALGTILDGTQPSIALPGGPGPDIYPAPEPELKAAAHLLGNWLTANPVPLTGQWRGPQPIPSRWKLDTETAVVYIVDGGKDGLANVTGNFDADNGLFVWVNGRYKFGAVQPGYPSAADVFEYRNVNLGSLHPGRNFIQVLLVDSGTATGYKVKITSAPGTTATP